MPSLGWQEITGVVTLAGFVIWLMSKFIQRIYSDQKQLSFSMAELLKHNSKMNEEMIRAMQIINDTLAGNSQKIDKMENTVDNFSRILLDVVTKKRR